MNADRHSHWKRVQRRHKLLAAAAPAGHEAVVQVILNSTDEPLVVRWVETPTDDEDRWLLLFSIEGEPETMRPTDRIVLAHEDDIRRVEIGYRTLEGEPLGFACITVTDDD